MRKTYVLYEADIDATITEIILMTLLISTDFAIEFGVYYIY